jgi:glycosyltransferase involved in cell wall biosynthesis
MPFSSDDGKADIKRIIGKLKHDKMLDIGCGSGTYARLFPDAEWTGVEIHEPYIGKYKLNDLYKNLINEDARTWTPTEHYDVAVAGDVLEHMEEEEAVALLEKLKACADTVVVSIPIGYYPQDEYDGNEHEEHITDDWTDEYFREVFGQPTWYAIDGEIGVYIWSKHKIGLKICVYAISKNEEQFVERFCNSAKEADLILIADTGSTDKTAEKAREMGAMVPEIYISPWRFDLARNAALALIPRDIDVCISLDLDEILQPGWREEIERVWTPGTTRLRYFFDWGVGIKFKYEKIHARIGYKWHHPCHEYPVPDGRITEVWADTDMLLAVHKPDPTKSRGQYLDILKVSVEEDPYCPRNAFYYARELTFHARWHESIKELNRYLALPGATWINERCYAMRTMGRAYTELGDMYNAEKWFHLAAAEAPNTREPWCELAMLLYRQSRWAECFAASMRALQITERELVYTCDPEVWEHWPHDLASVAAWNLGLKRIALEQAQLAVTATPTDPRLVKNLKAILDSMVDDDE